MLPADQRLRRQTFAVLGLAAILAIVAVICFHYWLLDLGTAPGNDLLIFRLRRMIGVALTGSALCLALLAWHAAHKASRIRNLRQWPLPGTRVIRDTPIRRDTAALSVGRQLNAIAILLLALAFALGYISWQMLR